MFIMLMVPFLFQDSSVFLLVNPSKLSIFGQGRLFPVVILSSFCYNINDFEFGIEMELSF